MRCPKCKYEPTAEEHSSSSMQCVKCGVYYAKYIAQLKVKITAKKASQDAQTASPQPSAQTASAKTFVEQSLSRGEHTVCMFSLHWIVWVRVAIWVALGVATAFLTWVIAVYDILRIRTTEHALTNTRVMVKTGIISRNTKEMRLKSIETIEINQGVLGRLFGYGQVRITGRGTGDVVFKTINNPMEVKRRIEDFYNEVEAS